MTHFLHGLYSPQHPIAVLIFWLSASLIVYACVGYSLLLRLLASLVGPRPTLKAATPSLTMIICAHNEEASLQAKLEATLLLTYPREQLQIIVVSDGSTDATNEIAASFAPRGIDLLQIHKQKGKTNAQNRAVLMARGEVLVFSDATTRYHPDALLHLASSFGDPRVGAVSGRYIYEASHGDSSMAAGATAYASYDNKLRAMQAQVGSITGCCGCIYAVRRALYTPLHEHLISDLVQPLHVLRQGFRVTFEPRALGWEAATNSLQGEFRMRVRVVARAVTGVLSVPSLLLPWRDPWVALQLWSHKVLRWMLPILLLMIFASSIVLVGSATLYAYAALFQGLLYSIAIVTLLAPVPRSLRLLEVPLYFCTVNAATAAGIVQFLLGRRYVVWSPQRGTS